MLGGGASSTITINYCEFADNGVRVQVVLPGAEGIMPVGAMVDAALAGLDLGEWVTIP